jgi:invasion protein IalB
MAGEKRDHGIGILLAAAAGSIAAVVAMTATAFAQAPAAPGSTLTLPGLAAGAAAAAAPQAGAAQAGAAPAPQWIKLCSPDPTTKKNLCLIQEEIYADTGQLIASATIRSVQDDPKLQFIVGVPPGMLLQPGVQFQIDMTGKPQMLMYTICFPNTCYADMDITADFVKPMRTGKQLVVAAINQAGQPETFPISLAGFSKVYDGPGIDPNTPTGQATLNALTASLQAHADAARQALITQQQQRP